MCDDYKDLNKACPKDPYPLLDINRTIDATVGHELLSFMDAFSWYNQIKMQWMMQRRQLLLWTKASITTL